MKNIFLKSSLTCILIFLVSCSNESTTELNVLDKNQRSENIIEHPLNELQFDKTNNANIERIKKWHESKITENLINKNSEFDLDFNNVNSYKIDDKEFIIVNQKNINPNNSENNGVSFLKENGVIRPLFHVKTLNFSENIKKIEYFSLSGKSIMSVTFNKISKEIKFKSSPINKKSSFGIIKSGFKYIALNNKANIVYVIINYKKNKVEISEPIRWEQLDKITDKDLLLPLSNLLKNKSSKEYSIYPAYCSDIKFK